MTDNFHRLEFRHLEAFRAIVRAETFNAAASESGYSQSVLSAHLAALEKIVGQKLIERGRGKRRIELTPAGEILLTHADAIAVRLAAALTDLESFAQGFSGSIRVGTYQSVSHRIVPKLLQTMSRDFPGVNLQVRESANDSDLLPLLENGELDFAFTSFPLPAGPFAGVELIRDPWMLLTQPDAEIAQQKSPVSVHQLMSLTHVGFGETSPVQVQMENYLRGFGIELNIIFRTNDNVAVHELVATGYASALMPKLAVNIVDDRIVSLAVDMPTRSIALAWNSERQLLPFADTFIQQVQQISASVIG